MDTPLELVRMPSRDGRPMKALLAEGDVGAPGAVILHGYGSRKDNHVDFAQRLAALGLWVRCPTCAATAAPPARWMRA